MIDLNFLFKLIFIKTHILYTFLNLINFPIVVYLLAKYFESSFCGDLILFYLINGVFLIPVTVFHVIAILATFDMRDLFGKNSLMSVANTPIYIMNMGMGIYFSKVKKSSSECISESKNENLLLWLMFYVIFIMSIVVIVSYIISFLIRIYIVKHVMPRYTNTVYYEANQQFIKDTEKEEEDEKKSFFETLKLSKYKNSMDPFKKLNMDSATIVEIK